MAAHWAELIRPQHWTGDTRALVVGGIDAPVHVLSNFYYIIILNAGRTINNVFVDNFC